MRGIDVPAMDGKRVRVAHGDQVVLVMIETPVEGAEIGRYGLHASVMLRPDDARELARIVKRQSKDAAR